MNNTVPKKTWFDGKRYQLANGNTNTSTKARFPPSLFPIIRSFWHHTWTKSNMRTDRKVLCLSWNLEVFWSIPFWEHDVNPNIPIE